MSKRVLIEPEELKHLASLLPDLPVEEILAMAPKWYNQALRTTGIVAREVASAMRTMETIADLSIQLRQVLPMLFVDPKAYGSGTKEGVRSLKRFLMHEDANAVLKTVLDGHANHRLAPLADAAKKYTKSAAEMTDLAGTDFRKTEEFFAGNLIDQVPGLKGAKHISNLHFATVANKVRSDAYYRLLERWERKYPELAKQFIETGELSPELFGTKQVQSALTELHDAGAIVNILTGRGELGALEKYAPTLQTLFFAPKYTAAAVESVPYSVLMAVRSPLVRKEVAKGFAGLAVTAGSLIAMAKMNGGHVEVDPRSTDFGKLRIGDTRINILGGLQPVVRYTAQIATGTRKSASGQLYESDRGDDLARFLRSKTSPVAGLITDMWTGETFIGEDADLSKESVARTAWQKFTPMFVQDVYDAVKQEGAEGAAMAAPGFFGASITSYGPESNAVKDYRDSVAKKAYGMDWETLGKTKGKMYQTMLEESDAKLSGIVEKQDEKRLKEAGMPKTDWDRWYGAHDRITADVDRLIQANSDRLMAGEMTPKAFRLRVDEIMSNARYARDKMELDPQYKSVQTFLNTPSGKKMSVNDVAYNEYINRVYDGALSDDFGNYDYAKAEQRKQEIRAKYGAETFQYIQQRLAMGHKDDPPALQALRQARETLKPYWGIEDQAWAQFPQKMQVGAESLTLKEIADRIKMLEATDPDAAKRALRRYPRIVAVRKRITQQKKQMRLRDRNIDAALVFYR